ncbi:hypothetical protein PVAP13_7KG301603 [Panicum virgatum]|uniref:Uncharacterized protein n=1 Tax=Panicum virgatum TaxID=38727 RepID=A0A8T0QP93_PANVG|nr:hypothetical protein PVAP13_7KG301603 [Panicum virgatum]
MPQHQQPSRSNFGTISLKQTSPPQQQPSTTLQKRASTSSRLQKQSNLIPGTAHTQPSFTQASSTQHRTKASCAPASRAQPLAPASVSSRATRAAAHLHGRPAAGQRTPPLACYAAGGRACSARPSRAPAHAARAAPQARACRPAAAASRRPTAQRLPGASPVPVLAPAPISRARRPASSGEYPNSSSVYHVVDLEKCLAFVPSPD